MRPVPDISEAENFRMEPITAIRRDPIEPVPVGTYIVKLFRVEGYDQDCDGSLMARLANVDCNGEETGWTPHSLGVGPNDSLVVDDPGELWRLVK